MGEFNLNQLVLLVYIHLAILLGPGFIYLMVDEYQERKAIRMKHLKAHLVRPEATEEKSKAA